MKFKLEKLIKRRLSRGVSEGRSENMQPRSREGTVKQKVIDVLVSYGNEGVSLKQIAKETGLDDTQVSNALSRIDFVESFIAEFNIRKYRYEI